MGTEIYEKGLFLIKINDKLDQIIVDCSSQNLLDYYLVLDCV